MKRRIFIGFSIILIIFFIGGIFCIYTLETSRAKFNRLITLHQVQILRANLLVSLQRLQTDLYLFSLQGSRSPQGRGQITQDLADLEATINHCFRCHHPEALRAKLLEAKGMVNVYKSGITGMLDAASPVDFGRAEDSVISHGKVILTMFSEIVNTANRNLSNRTVEVSQYVKSIETYLYVSMFLGLIMAAFIAVRFEKQIMKPIGAILAGAENISMGNLDHRIPEAMPKELALVAVSFNRMASQLRENIEKIKKTEQIELMREIAAGLAHEIKNPLTGIKGALEVFMRDLNLSSEERAVFEEMLFQIKKLDVMTKCFLEYARPPKPQIVPTSVNDILNNTVAFVTRHNLHRNIQKVQITKELAASLPPANVDPVQLQQVLMNLIFNALDAMPAGGALRFKTFQEDRYVEIDIGDTGHGIDQETIANIFKPFFTTKSKGMGIGLSICKRLVEQQNGTISVESGNWGTIFRLKLPQEAR